MAVPSGLRERRRELVGNLWLRGYSYTQIAEAIRTEAARSGRLQGADKTHRQTVYKDVKACEAEWRERIQVDLDGKRAAAAARLQGIIRQSWQEFTRATGARSRAQFLNVVLSAEEKLSKIEGTQAPTRLAGPQGEPLFNPETTQAMIEAVAKARQLYPGNVN